MDIGISPWTPSTRLTKNRTFISANCRIEFSVPRQLSEVNTLHLVSVTGGHKVDRGGTYKLSEGVALVTLLLEREGREAAVRRLLSVEPDLGSTPTAREFGGGAQTA